MPNFLNYFSKLSVWLYFDDDSCAYYYEKITYDIISNYKKELVYIDYDLYPGYLEELDFSKQTDDVKKWAMENPEAQLLSTRQLFKLLKSKRPDWFEKPMETEYSRESFPIKDLWESTSI